MARELYNLKMISATLDPAQIWVPRAVTDAFAEEVKSRIELQEDPKQVYAVYYSGEGTVKFKNGNLYKGDVWKGLLHGQGRMVFRDGAIYEGSFQYNQLEGKGRLVWTEECSYEGEFKAGIRHGHGVFENPGKGSRYQGGWVDGKRHGQGELVLRDGSIYQGDFRHGTKAGIGKQTYPSGNYYEGNWQNGVKHGHGTMYWVAEKQKYEGDWVSDEPNGVGTLVWLEEPGANKVLRNRYHGQFVSGLRHGLGVFYYANGSSYEGSWFQNLKQGYAVYTDDLGHISHCYFWGDRLVRKVAVADSLLQTLIHSNRLQSSFVKHRSQKSLAAEEKTAKPDMGKDEPVENLYMKLVDLKDIVAEDIRPRVLAQVSEVLLRYHSQLRSWYSACAADVDHPYPEGFFLDLSAIWKLVESTRLGNGRLNHVALARLVSRLGQKEFSINFEEQKLTRELELVRKYDFESPEAEAEVNSVMDAAQVEKKIEALLLEDWAERKKAQNESYSPRKVILFRSFVNWLVRLVHLKTGSGSKLAMQIDKIFGKRIGPLLSGEIRPKRLVHEEGPIVAKSKTVIEKFRAELEHIYSLGRNFSYKFAEGDKLDTRNFLIILRQLGLWHYQNPEEQLQTWMMLERIDDPEESVFRLIAKKIQKNKQDERMEQKIKVVLLPKMHKEWSFQEFAETLLLFLAKHRDLSAKLTIFANKLSSAFKSVLENPGVKPLEKKKPRMARTFPRSQKDLDCDNIEAIKDARAQAQEAKKKLIYQMQEERAERQLMATEDNDISDFLISPKKDPDAFEQEDEESESYDAQNDGDSYFEAVGDTKERSTAKNAHH